MNKKFTKKSSKH